QFLRRRAEANALVALALQNRERRREAAEQVEDMVDKAKANLLDEFKQRRVEGVIAGMYQGAERVKRRELETALAKVRTRGDLPDESREKIEQMADSIVSKLLAPPTEAIRDAAVEEDWNTIEAAIEIFDPEKGGLDGLEGEISVHEASTEPTAFSTLESSDEK
ncbi:MAG: hypothetical protein ABEI52_02525, partial [Halobacteriaceae archaeon]